MIIKTNLKFISDIEFNKVRSLFSDVSYPIKLGQERLRLHIQKPYQINVYTYKWSKVGYYAAPHWSERNLHETVCRQMQTN